MNILDSSAYLAVIFEEKGSEVIRRLSEESVKKKESIFMHQLNMAEVLYKVTKKYTAEKANTVLMDFCSPWWGKLDYLDSDLIRLASNLKSKYQDASLAVCVGLACAKIFEDVFWTCDKELAKYGEAEGIKVKLIR